MGRNVLTPARDGFWGQLDPAKDVTFASGFPALGNQITGLEIHLSIVEMTDNVFDDTLWERKHSG